MTNLDASQFIKVAERISSESNYDLNQTTMLMNMYLKSGNNITDYTIDQLKLDANAYTEWYQDLPTAIKQNPINPLLLFTTINSSDAKTVDDEDEDEDEESNNEDEDEEYNNEDEDDDDESVDEQSDYKNITTKVIKFFIIYINVYIFTYLLHSNMNIELDYMYIFTYFILTISLVQMFQLLDTFNYNQHEDEDEDEDEDEKDEDKNEDEDEDDLPLHI